MTGLVADGGAGGAGVGGGGAGWGNPGGFGDATTTTTNQSVANLVVDIFDGSSKNLLWRGLATEDLSTNANKNTKSLDSDIARMFKGFPPQSRRRRRDMHGEEAPPVA